MKPLDHLLAGKTLKGKYATYHLDSVEVSYQDNRLPPFYDTCVHFTGKCQQDNTVLIQEVYKDIKKIVDQLGQSSEVELEVNVGVITFEAMYYLNSKN